MLSLELVLLHGIEVCRVPLYRSMWYGHLRRMVGACVFRGHSSRLDGIELPADGLELSR